MTEQIMEHCGKCGSAEIHYEFCDKFYLVFKHGRDEGRREHPNQHEVLHLTCRRCNYFWNIMPLDAKGESQRV